MNSTAQKTHIRLIVGYFVHKMSSLRDFEKIVIFQIWPSLGEIFAKNMLTIGDFCCYILSQFTIVQVNRKNGDFSGFCEKLLYAKNDVLDLLGRKIEIFLSRS